MLNLVSKEADVFEVTDFGSRGGGRSWRWSCRWKTLETGIHGDRGHKEGGLGGWRLRRLEFEEEGHGGRKSWRGRFQSLEFMKE